MFTILGHVLPQYDPWLAALAVTACGVACITTSMVLARAQSASGPARALLIGLAAAEFGGGTWSLHVGAMLAFLPAQVVAISVLHSLLSLLVGIGGALAAFVLLLQPRPARGWHAAADGTSIALLLTGAVAGLQYGGLFSLQAPATVALDRPALILSLAVCAGLCALAAVTLRRVHSFRFQVAAAAVLAAAVCVSHVTGLAAVDVHVNGPLTSSSTRVPAALALAAAATALTVSGLLLLVAIAASDRRAAARAIHAGQRIAEMANLSFEGLAVERAGVLVAVNARLCELMGRDAGTLLGRPFAALLPDSEGATPRAGVRSSDRNVVHGDGHLIPVELLVRQVEYRGASAKAIAVRDMTRRRRNVADLHHLAQFDPLTGTANHVLLAERLADAISDSGEQKPVAVLRFGIDRFQAINDQLGRLAGDKLLVAVAERLGALVRGTDTLARLGGDEFVVVLPPPDGVASIALSLASRIVDRLAEPFGVDGHRLEIGVSLGIAMSPGDATSAADLIRCAGLAMHSVKDSTRGTYRLFHAAMDRQSQDRRALERLLRDAIQEETLGLQFQPVVNAETGAVEAYEALARWTHPDRGSIPPAEFLPMAEDLRLILTLDRWVLARACQAAVRWPGEAAVTVNMSVAQLHEPDAVGHVLATLARCGLPAKRLEIEITEAALLKDPVHAATVLAQLQKAGIRVALDDFGSGSASIGHLRRFPLAKVKIDRSLMQDIAADRHAADLVRDMTTLAHTLGLAVTAEGVETLAQSTLVSSLGCDQMQGFLLGRPAADPGGAPPPAVFSTPAPTLTPSPAAIANPIGTEAALA